MSIFKNGWELYLIEIKKHEKENFNYIVTVCNNAANETCPIYNEDSIKIHWDIEDPAAIKDEKLIEEKFKYVFNILKKKIKEEFLS